MSLCWLFLCSGSDFGVFIDWLLSILIRYSLESGHNINLKEDQNLHTCPWSALEDLIWPFSAELIFKVHIHADLGWYQKIMYIHVCTQSSIPLYVLWCISNANYIGSLMWTATVGCKPLTKLNDVILDIENTEIIHSTQHAWEAY